MKTTTHCLKSHFNLTERETLVPLLDAHVEYLCRVIRSIPNFSQKIVAFSQKIAGWYAAEYPTCPEVAINATFGVRIATHNNVLGQESQYYYAQWVLDGSPAAPSVHHRNGQISGWKRTRRVRYLWAAIHQILAEDMSLATYTSYSTEILNFERDCVVCPICGEVVAEWTEDDYIRTPCQHMIAEFDNGNHWGAPEVDNVIDHYAFFDYHTDLFETVTMHDCEFWFSDNHNLDHLAEVYLSDVRLDCPICGKTVLNCHNGMCWATPCDHSVKLMFDGNVEYRQEESLWEEQGFDIEATCKGKMHKVAEFCEGFFFEEDEDEEEEE